MKCCSTCKVEKPLDAFNHNKRFEDGRHYSCRECTNKQKMESYFKNHEASKKKQREDRKKNPDKQARYSQQKRLKKYGITSEEVNIMRIQQNGLCAICQTQLTSGKQGEHVDHDHETGIVRALLCGSCNCMIGYAKENIDILISGATYLLQFQSQGSSTKENA